jgi:hypothetical protein
MAKIAGYIYALNKKGDATYDTDELIKFLHTKAEEKGVAINEVYIDGDPSVPNGIEELVSDIRNYDGVMLYSLEGLSEDHIVALGRKSLFCVNAPWVAGKAASAELKAVIRSRAYYDNMRSLNIRMGIKNSTKVSGQVPYGYQRNPTTGTLEEKGDEQAIIGQVLSLKASGIGVTEISKKLGELSVSRIYRIINTAKRDDNN